MSTKINVPFFSDEFVNSSQELLKEISEVLDSRNLILGQRVTEFEQNFAQFLGASHCITVANGTDALEIALRALKIGRGDKVATVANAGFYTSTAVHQIGAETIFIEIEPDSFLISTEDLTKKIEQEKISAIVVTHLYGLPANVEEIVKLAKARNIYVVEDCAQAHGLKINNKFAGSFGDISTFSFYPTKNLGAIGDGGALVTSNSDLAAIVKSIRQYGWGEKYDVKTPFGRNSRLDEIQAAVLNKKLESLQKNNELRKLATNRYMSNLANLPIKFSNQLQNGVAHLMPIVVETREMLMNYLLDSGVQTAIHYPIPDHKQSAYQYEIKLPVTEEFCKTVMSLPIFPGMSNAQIDYVSEKIKDFYESR